MPLYKVVYRAESPLSLGDGFEYQNLRTTRDYIAGGVWRGALAAMYLGQLGLEAGAGKRISWGNMPPEFTALFQINGEGARFGFLYPRWSSDTQGLLKGDDLAAPVPLSYFSCKNHPGFEHDDGHGVHDYWNDRVRQLAGEKPDRLSCRQCGGRMELLRGNLAGQPGSFQLVKTGRASLTRVGLNRFTETAEEGILYAVEILPPRRLKGKEEQLHFSGWLDLPEGKERDVEKILSVLPGREGGYFLPVGTARSRGLGHGLLFLKPLAGKKARRVQGRPGMRLGDGWVYVPLLARSPLVVRGEDGRPVALPGKRELAAYLDQVPGALEPVPGASFVEWGEVSGYSQVWGLPRPLTAGVMPGSVLTYRLPEAEEEALHPWLEELAAKGLGEGTAWGWGELVVIKGWI